jgi:hypothetical protein
MKIIIILVYFILSIILWKKYNDYEDYINEPYITVYAKCGLGNKVRVLLSYLYRANQENKKLKLYWVKDNECPDNFESLFKPIDNVSIHNLEDTNNYDYNTWDEDNTLYYDYYKLLKPIDSIQKEIDSKIKLLDNNYIACHIRRTDAFIHSVYADNLKKDDEYINFINSFDKSYKIYIATDCRDTQKKFIDMYKDRMIYKEISDQNYNDSIRQTSVQDAVVDIYVCASATYFMRSFGSFSDTIYHLRKINNLETDNFETYK